MATYLLTRQSDFEMPPIFLATTMVDLFRVIHETFQKESAEIQADRGYFEIVERLGNLHQSAWEEGLHFIEIKGQEWMLVVITGERAFGMV